MARETSYAGKLGDWQRLLEPLAANAAELPHLEVPRARLATLVAQAMAVGKQQAARAAAKQELSRQLKVAVVEGDRLATLLRAAVKQQYGIHSEKLAEFGVQPFRGRPHGRRAPLESATPQDQPRSR